MLVVGLNGEPLIQAEAPAGTAYLAVQFCLNSPDAVVDHDYTSIAY